MTNERPDYLKQGEPARLFPVLATTSKEGRTTSIVLACFDKVREFGAALLESAGQRFGVRSELETYTEIVFKSQTSASKDRPDGLIVLKSGSRQWRALVETKIGSAELTFDQVERYRALAKENGLDCVITISNQFATAPHVHPLEEVRRSRSKIPVIHWSWMHILTQADLLLSAGSVADADQRILLNELRRFLTHDSAGVKGFDSMPREWTELNKLVSAGGGIPAKSPLVQPVLEAWHQETRDLSLILSRMTGEAVSEKLPRAHVSEPAKRQKDETELLRTQSCLRASLSIPNAAALIEIEASLQRRSIDVGMALRAPEDKKSTKARVNWILRQVKTEKKEDLYLRLMWPGKSEPTQFAFDKLLERPEAAEEGKEHLAPHSFHIFRSSPLGSKFAQQRNFVSELERLVPEFYGQIGSQLKPWVKKAPTLKTDRTESTDVSTDAIAEDAENYDA